MSLNSSGISGNIATAASHRTPLIIGNSNLYASDSIIRLRRSTVGHEGSLILSVSVMARPSSLRSDTPAVMAALRSARHRSEHRSLGALQALPHEPNCARFQLLQRPDTF